MLRSERRDPILWIGLGLFAYQLCLAWCFYLERTTTADSAFFSLQLIQTGSFVEALGRYGSWLAELLPLALIHLKAPLDLVLKSYSVSFVLIDIGVFLFLALRLRDREAMIALPLVKTVAYSYTFYYGISELYQGLTLMVLMWALLKRFLDPQSRRTTTAVTILALTVWSSFYHQLLVFPLGFILVLECMRGDLWRDRWFWGSSIVLVGWYAARILLFTRSSYEAQRMPSLEEMITYGAQLRELGSTKYLEAVYPKFFSFLLLLAITAFLAARKRAVVLFLATLFISAAVMVLLLITDHDGASPNVYENYYAVVGFFWALLFARLILVSDLSYPWLSFAMVVVLALGGLQIWRAHYLVTAHVRYSQRMTDEIRERGIRKGISSPLNFPWGTAWGTWPVAMEMALVSAQNGPGDVATVYVSDNLSDVENVLQDPRTFLGPTWAPQWFAIDRFPKHYLDFPPQGYVKLNTVVKASVLSLIPMREIVLESLAPELQLVNDRFTVTEVRISNRSKHTFGSILQSGTPMRITYDLLDEEGTVLGTNVHFTELEIDLPPGEDYIQALVIERPKRRGTYRIRAYVLAEGYRTWDTGPTITAHLGWW